MSTRLAHVVIGARDPSGLARFWATALGWRIVSQAPHEVEIEGGSEDVNVIFVAVPEVTAAKGRVHLDLATAPDEDQGPPTFGWSKPE